MTSREEEEGGKGFEVEVKVDSSLLVPPDELRCEFDECKNWRLHEKKFCQLHFFKQLKKMKNQSKGVKRNRGKVEKIEKNDGKKKDKKNGKGLKEKSELDDNGDVDENGEKRNEKKIVNGEEIEKIEALVPLKKNGGNRNEVALMEKCDLDVNNGVGGDDLVMEEDLESKLVQKRTEIRRSTRLMTVAGKNGDIITEKKSDEGGLDHGEDDKSGKNDLEVSREEKKDATMEVLVQKNEKKKKHPSRNKGVETKKDHLEVEELMHVEDDKERAERNLQERGEDKQDEKLEIPLMKEDGDITEKKIDEGELVEDDKGVKNNLQGNKEDEKMEVPMKKNEKKQKKKVKKDKVEGVQKNDLDEERLLLVEDDKKGDGKSLHEREEDKKDEEINNPVKKNVKKKVKKDKMEVVKRNEVDEGQLLQVDDKKGDEKNLHEQEDKKNEIDIPVKKNEKKKNKSDKQGKGKKNDFDEEKILRVENDKGSERNLHEQEEDKKDKEIDIPVKKNVKKRKSEKNMGEKEKKTNFDGVKGTKKNLQELEDKKDENIDIPVKKCKRNKGEDKQKIDLVGVHVLKASSELVECEPVKKCDDDNMELSGEIQELNDDVVDDKGVKESQQETEGKIKIPLKRNAKKNKGNAENKQVLESSNMPNSSSEPMKVEGNSGRESDDKQKKESQQETVEGKIKNPVKRNAKKKNKGITVNKQDSEIVNMPKDSSELMKVEGNLGRESEDKNCDIAGSSHKLAGASKGHVLKSKGEPLVETKGELRHTTRSTVGGANVISEDGEQRMIVQALQAMPTGGAKDGKVSKKTGSVKVAKQNPKESKKDKKLELDDGATKVVKYSSNEKQGTVSNVADESLEDFEEAKVDFADNVCGKEKKMKGCVSKSKDETVVIDKQTLEPKIELRRSRRTTTGGSS